MCNLAAFGAAIVGAGVNGHADQFRENVTTFGAMYGASIFFLQLA
jgi:hypothetical protein